MGQQFDRASSMRELCRAARECRRGVSWKDGPMEYYIGRIAACKRLRDDLLAGRYKMRPGTPVKIYRPKYRLAMAPWFRDRVWQRSMCNNGLYDDLTCGFIRDNYACQRGKGNDMAIRRVIEFLQKLHRMKPGAPVWGEHLDVKKYFPSTPHAAVKALDAERVTEAAYLPYLNEIIDGVRDKRPKSEIEADSFGERGTGLGSQINQLNQIALLDRLDHTLKRTCRFYIRYNDDMLILDHDRAVVEAAKATVEEYLAANGLTMTDKSGPFRVEHGFYFLRKRFSMTATGKINLRLHKGALGEERRALRGLKQMLIEGRRTIEDVRRHYQSWIANAEYAGDAPIRAMDRFYTELFRQKPVYKRKERYLYGKDHPRHKRTPAGGGAGECGAAASTGEGPGHG